MSRQSYPIPSVLPGGARFGTPRDALTRYLMDAAFHASKDKIYLSTNIYNQIKPVLAALLHPAKIGDNQAIFYKPHSLHIIAELKLDDQTMELE